MGFSPFKKSKCLISDDLFLEIIWEDGKSPEDDSELLGIIEGLDQVYIDQFPHPIEESLPYLSFYQAESLFQTLQQTYGHFQLKKVAIATLEGKKVVTEGEVFASPFVIDSGYQNLLLPLIQSILTQPSFNSYTYQEKREYFENQIYPVYRDVMGISDSSLPLFPVEGEQVRKPVPVTKNKPRQSATQGSSSTKQVSLKGVYALLGVTSLLAIGGLGLSFVTYQQLSQKTEQVNYLYAEVKDLKLIISEENKVDVFGRYFLSTYYSGNKEVLAEYLSDGNAKYTVPQTGVLQSAILETITYDSETEEYHVAYVLSVKKEEATRIRLSFSIKADDSAKYGYIVTTEPIEATDSN